MLRHFLFGSVAKFSNKPTIILNYSKEKGCVAKFIKETDLSNL